MPVLVQSITEDNSQLASTSLFVQTSKLLSHLRKQLEKNSAGQKVLDTFWTSLDGICIEQVCLADADASSSRSLDKISMLLSQLLSQEELQGAKMEKKLSVTFSVDDDSGPSLHVVPTSTATLGLTSTEHPELIHLVRKLIRNSYPNARSGSILHLKFLVRILDVFQRVEVFEELSGEKDNAEPALSKGIDEMIGEQSETECFRLEKDILERNLEEKGDSVSFALVSKAKTPESVLLRCFEEVLLPWVQSEEDTSPGTNEDIVGHVVDVVEAAYRCCDDGSPRKAILDEFCRRTTKPQTLHYLIKKVSKFDCLQTSEVFIETIDMNQDRDQNALHRYFLGRTCRFAW